MTYKSLINETSGKENKAKQRDVMEVTVDMSADVMKIIFVVMAWQEKTSPTSSPSFFSVATWQTQPSKRQVDARCWLSCSFTPTIEPLGYPQCTAAFERPRHRAPERSSNCPLAPVTFKQTRKISRGGGSCFLQPSWVSSQPSASHLCCSARRAVEAVSRCSVCCAHWKEADYFLAMVHWLCRLAKNEDISHCANELGYYIKAKILFRSSNVSPSPEVGPSIWGL